MKENNLKLTFSGLNKVRLSFLKKNSEQDHSVVEGNNSVLISCPHSVPQVRLGKFKLKEVGSFCVALALQKLTDSFLIAKTKNNNDDANFDEISEYKNEIDNIVKQKNIKYVLDFHGLAAFRSCDVNLGINFGKNIENNVPAFDLLLEKLKEQNFIVSIDQPFAGGGNTISGTVKFNHPNCFTMQIEINSKITNFAQNFERTKKLIYIFENWINNLR